MKNLEVSLNYLRDLKTVRHHARLVYELGLADKLKYFRLYPQKLDLVTDYVIAEMHANYPDGKIPYHSRMRHFESTGSQNINRVNLLKDEILRSTPRLTKEEWGQTLYDLIITSVLLDAGAGPDWQYKEPKTGQVFARSEGLAIASFHLFTSGLLSQDPQQPFKVTAEGLEKLKEMDLINAFQVTNHNQLLGVEGRVALLNRLGQTMRRHPEIFQGALKEFRLGHLFSYFLKNAKQMTLEAKEVFRVVVEVFNPIWPSGYEWQGQRIGDVGPYEGIQNTIVSGVIPFHKLSQWMSYSLFEPLEEYGIKIEALDDLTGLPEYRNGGLFWDLGAIEVKDATHIHAAVHPQSEFVVEWRALTVALLDEVAAKIRKKLGRTAEDLPLAQILQGGTWSAGRKIAKEKRGATGGGPPFAIISDGTIF